MKSKEEILTKRLVEQLGTVIQKNADFIIDTCGGSGYIEIIFNAASEFIARLMFFHEMNEKLPDKFIHRVKELVNINRQLKKGNKQ